MKDPAIVWRNAVRIQIETLLQSLVACHWRGDLDSTRQEVRKGGKGGEEEQAQHHGGDNDSNAPPVHIGGRTFREAAMRGFGGVETAEETNSSGRHAVSLVKEPHLSPLSVPELTSRGHLARYTVLPT